MSVALSIASLVTAKQDQDNAVFAQAKLFSQLRILL